MDNLFFPKDGAASVTTNNDLIKLLRARSARTRHFSGLLSFVTLLDNIQRGVKYGFSFPAIKLRPSLMDMV